MYETKIDITILDKKIASIIHDNEVDKIHLEFEVIASIT